MEPLEKYFNENRQLFDSQEPDTGHLSRFSDKLDKEFGKQSMILNRSAILKVAAVILLLITATVSVFDFAVNKVKNSIESKSTGTLLTPELEDAIQYYETRTSERLGEFRKLACCGEQQIRLNAMVSGQLNALDANSEELRKNLNENPDNERIQVALIKNQQMKEKVVENMIRQLKGGKAGGR